MAKQFSKAFEDKFMNDIQTMQIDQDDNEDESSIGDSFYEEEKKKLQEALSGLKIKQKNDVLEMVKQNTAKDDEEIIKHEQEIKELHKMTRTNQSNVLNKEVIQQIKERVFNQSAMHVMEFADQVIEMKKKKMDRKEKEIQEFQKKSVPSTKHGNQSQNKFQQKIDRAREQNQALTMAQQDIASMKYEHDYLSNFFEERFFTPEINNPKQTDTIIKIKFQTPQSTFTNLRPLPNNQNNVLPRNAPEIALRNLKKGKSLKLVSTSMSEVKVKFDKIVQKNPESSSPTKLKQDQIKNQKGNNMLNQALSVYVKSVGPMVDKVVELSKKYKPKFINQFPSLNEQNWNVGESGQTKSIGSCLQAGDEENLKNLKLTFEKITDLNGIQQCTNIEHAALQFNIIRNITGIDSCQKLIQLNISNNKVKDIMSLSNLRWLRILNIQCNQIEFVKLEGGNLQFLYASYNRIQQIADLSANNYMKKLIIKNNNLNSLNGLQQLLFLEEIDVSKNYLKNVEGIQSCISLRILNVSNNRLTQLYANFTAFFLNSLTLSGNYLTELPAMVLPSLEELYLDQNKLQSSGKHIIYLPNLKILNLDHNKITGFCTIWSLIRYSKKLQTLKYDVNQYFQDVREKVRQLYEHIIYRNMKNLSLLNQEPYDLGKKKYYEGVYSSYLDSHSMFCKQSQELRQIGSKINYLIKEQNKMSKMEDSKIRFSQTNSFIAHKSIKKGEDLREIIQFLKSNQMEKGHKIFHGWQSIFYKHDLFQTQISNAVHKIKGIAYRNARYRRKRAKHFQEKGPRLKQLLIEVEKQRKLAQLRSIVKIFSDSIRGLNQQKAAIIIQKNWRCYRQRRRYKKLLAKYKQKDDISDIDSFDSDDYKFQMQEIPEFNFIIPENIDFDQYIIRPDVFDVLKEREDERTKKLAPKVQPSQANNQGGHINQMNNNFMNENASAVSQQRISDDQQIQKLMKQWGINREAAKAIRANKRQKQMKKKKQAEKHLSAAEKYDRLRKNR